MSIRTWWVARRTRRDAQTRYWSCRGEVDAMHDALAHESNPPGRAWLLDRMASDMILISRAQYRWYVLGAPAVARLAQCVDAARSGRRPAAVVAGTLAVISCIASLLFGVIVLYVGWLGTQHRDVSELVPLGLLTAGLAVFTGLLAEVPVLVTGAGYIAPAAGPAATPAGGADRAPAARAVR